MEKKNNLDFPATSVTSFTGSTPTCVKMQYESKYRNVNYCLANRMI